ncbi:hypothetical protein GF323_04680 [Candidatus Woesearchaeota archaeon]|nr:hypothetical protein [Candidatus Woesearchaeota archaeon]
MTNSIVSIRMPESMVKSLKAAIKEGHYLDLSEAVRSIVRKRWLEWKDPAVFQIKKLRADIKEAVRDSSQKSKEELLLDELRRIKDMITAREVKK